MKNLIITGTRSISIADRAVAATMPENVKVVKTPEVELPNGLASAFVGNTDEDVKRFLALLQEIKTKWAARYKTLAGMTTNEKRADYRTMVIAWAQENGAPNFILDEPKVKKEVKKEAKSPKAKTTGAQKDTVVKKPAPKAPLNLEDEFGEESEAESGELDPEALPNQTDDCIPETSPEVKVDMEEFED